MILLQSKGNLSKFLKEFKDDNLRVRLEVVLVRSGDITLPIIYGCDCNVNTYPSQGGWDLIAFGY